MNSNTCAYVIAIGPFQPNISNHLKYPSKFYRNLPNNYPVINILFVCPTPSLSQKLANIFGFNIREPGTWYMSVGDRRHIDDIELRELILQSQCDEKEVEDFRVLRNSGFQFFFFVD